MDHVVNGPAPQELDTSHSRAGGRKANLAALVAGKLPREFSYDLAKLLSRTFPAQICG